MSWAGFKRGLKNLTRRPSEGMTPEDREDRRRREERRFWLPTAQLFDPPDPPRRKRSERDSD